MPFGWNGSEFTVSENILKYSELKNGFQFLFRNFGNSKIISDLKISEFFEFFGIFRIFSELEFFIYFWKISEFSEYEKWTFDPTATNGL